MLKKIGLALLLIVLLVALTLYLLGSGMLGDVEHAGTIEGDRLSPEVIEQRESSLQLADGEVDKQILFGDFHVHTTFSFDAFTMSLPLSQGDVGSHPPADACDFARYCSALDFWSINDHAETLTPRRWRETIDSIAQCNAVAGSADNPDMVSFLGWEWSQSAVDPAKHFGHKNVVLATMEADKIPSHPMAAPRQPMPIPPDIARGIMALALRDQRTLDMMTYLDELDEAPHCGSGSSDDSENCIRVANDPNELFAGLDELEMDSIVIPHGTAWGIYTPPGSDWRKQLENYHDSKRQTLLEVFSGHGNSERWIDNASIAFDDKGNVYCPAPTASFYPSCQRAGDIILQRCLDENIARQECEQRADTARLDYAEGGLNGSMAIPGTNNRVDWLDGSQCRDCFLPAFNYRRLGSAQYMLAMTDFDKPEESRRFDFGFISSSDNHSARPGTGYKEINPGANTDARQLTRAMAGLLPAEEAIAQSVALTDEQMSSAMGKEGERFNSFLYTGGLIALHSEGRGREAIWSALRRKEVYGTSGPKILLWFNKVDGEKPLAMGGKMAQVTNPVFEVRAAGSFKQLPGCPEHATQGLSGERLKLLCQGECDNPSDERRAITRIEVIKITPQQYEGEPVDNLVADPWKVFSCDSGEQTCTVTFSDDEFVTGERHSVYYVRAIEEPSDTINGANLACEYDENGRCIAMRDCGNNEPGNDCLAPVEHRAWSSPIYVDYAPAG